MKKQRHHFANKGPCSQSYGFSSSHVWMWELDNKNGWVPKNDAFEPRCWKRLLRLPWTVRISNQSILRKSNPEYSLERLTLTLKLQYFGHLIRTATSLEKSLMMRKIMDRRRRGWDSLMASLIQWTWTWVYFRRWWVQGGLVCFSPSGHKESDTTGQLNNNLFCHEHLGVYIFKS